MGQVVGEIDLRLFLRHWAFGYVLDEDTRSGPRRSLQFFDRAGAAVHKVYATRRHRPSPASTASPTRAPTPTLAPA